MKDDEKLSKTNEVKKGGKKRRMKVAEKPSKEVAKKTNMQMEDDDDDYIMLGVDVSPLPMKRLRKGPSAKSSVVVERPKVRLTKYLVDELETKDDPNVSQAVGDTPKGVVHGESGTDTMEPDQAVGDTPKGVVHGKSGIDTMELDLDPVPDFDSLLALETCDPGVLVEVDHPLRSPFGPGRGKGPMLSPDARRAMQDGFVSPGLES